MTNISVKKINSLSLVISEIIKIVINILDSFFTFKIKSENSWLLRRGILNRVKSDVTEKIIGCFYKVYNALGFGFVEKVYENALCVELGKCGFDFKQQYPIKVKYNNSVVGEFVCDILIDNSIILEVKATGSLLPIHDAQLMNYLKATGIRIGLLLNFGSEPQVRRKVF